MPGLSGTFDAAGAHRYMFKIDGYQSTNIKQVTQLTMKLDPIQTKTVDSKGRPSYNVFAGNKQFVGSMKVVRLMTEDLTWYTWFEATMKNVVDSRVPCFLEVHDPRMSDPVPVRTYTFESCVPTELSISDMNAAGTAPVDENLTFYYTNMTIST